MADDLDQLIRAAMKTLDDQVPSGYFEALPNQTIARLEGSMQHGSSGTTDTRNQVAPPPVSAMEADSAPAATQSAPAQGEDREDSGLHDIRNLAQSTKQRLSSRRSTQNPIVSDDVLASSSGSFKNIALPQPARMVSLPEIEDLPPPAAVVAAEKASKKAAKETKSDKIAAVSAPAPAVETPVAAAAPAVAPRQAFSLPSQQGKKSKAPLLAIVGTGLAAAAGYVVFLQVNKAEDKAAMATAESGAGSAAATAPAVTAQAIEPAPAPAPPPAEAPADPAKADEAAAAAPVAEIAADDGDDKNADGKAKKSAKKGKKSDDTEKAVVEQKPEKVDVKKPAPAAKGGGGEEGEPSFDALLKEAGVAEKKEAKPTLDKKSLTGDDFKKGMAAVNGKAKGCYAGTQGTAMVKLTVAPSGQVSKVSVGGEFAGKPEASCVESAIKAATFPAWDGGPQSFTYSVLLSD
jgi:hypothetical protein